MTRISRLVAAVLTVLATAATAQDGFHVDRIAQVSVLDGGPTARGTHLAALRIDLAPGWKTYWRAPGDAGIPPQIDWSGSQNLEAVAITWPTPHVFDQNGMRSIGYADQLILPFEITPARDGAPLHLRGRLDFGVCEEVCVPARLDFDQGLSAEAGRHPAVAAAFADRPLSQREAGVGDVVCVLSPSRDGLWVEAHVTVPRLGASEVAVIEPGVPGIWASEASVARSGEVLVARAEFVPTSGRTRAIDRSDIRITVLAGGNAVDIRGCSAG